MMMGGGGRARRVGLAGLSNTLFTSPSERKSFLANPSAYSAKFTGVTQQDITDLQRMLADGICCGGCGCGSGAMQELQQGQ